MISCSAKSRTDLRVISCVSVSATSMSVRQSPPAGYNLRGPNLDDPRGTRRGHVAATRAPADDGGPRLLAGVPLGSHGPADGRPEGPHGPVSGPSAGGAAVSFLRKEGRPADRDGPPRSRGDFGILNGTRFGG